MELTEEEIAKITQIEAIQSLLFPHIRICVREYGPYITQNALDFFSSTLDQAIEEQEAEWKSRGNSLSSL